MSVTGAMLSATGATMSTTATTTSCSAPSPTPAYLWDLNPSPARLSTHNAAGFTRLYLLPPTHLTAPVQSPQRHGDVTTTLSLKTRVQANLIRLFQLAVFFDDFLPVNPSEEPSDKLMTIIETLWDVDHPLGPNLMREVLGHWYERHVDWWKANRRSKHAVEKGRELLLVNLADQYRRSRRYWVPRRVREASSVDPAVVCCREDGIRDGDGDGEYHLRLLGSRVLQWKQVMFNCPGAVYERVLPVPPMMDAFMVDMGTTMAEHLIYRLLKAPIIVRGMALSQLVATDCSWALADPDPALAQMYRKLKAPKKPEKEKDGLTDDQQTDPEETLCHETETEIAEADDETEVEDRDEPRLRKKRGCTEPSTRGDAATPDYDASGEDEEVPQDTGFASVEDTEDESSDEEEEADEDDEEEDEQDDEKIAETKDAAEVTDEDDEEYDPDDEDDEDYED
ncbi:hypothetical protein GE09DRAFT_1230065 [Coniochaeta sp. 2T2.1]|nr:hypothetical protein GE09DRAFT_1230065 [Coniochaeta sp. 2T2.1]